MRMSLSWKNSRMIINSFVPPLIEKDQSFQYTPFEVSRTSVESSHIGSGPPAAVYRQILLLMNASNAHPPLPTAANQCAHIALRLILPGLQKSRRTELPIVQEIGALRWSWITYKLQIVPKLRVHVVHDVANKDIEKNNHVRGCISIWSDFGGAELSSKFLSTTDFPMLNAWHCQRSQSWAPR